MGMGPVHHFSGFFLDRRSPGRGLGGIRGRPFFLSGLFCVPGSGAAQMTGMRVNIPGHNPVQMSGRWAFFGGSIPMNRVLIWGRRQAGAPAFSPEPGHA